MSLARKTRELEASETAALDMKTLNRIQQADRDVIGSALYETAISAGMTAPDFALVDQEYGRISLSRLLERGPLVLSFNRGSWCGYCRLELAALEEAREALAAHGAQIVSVTPQSISANRALCEEQGLAFPILSDPGARTASLYGLAYRLPPELHDVYREAGLDIAEWNAGDGDSTYLVPVPATYLISPQGEVLYNFFDANYRNRLDPGEMIDTLAAYSR